MLSTSCVVLRRQGETPLVLQQRVSSHQLGRQCVDASALTRVSGDGVLLSWLRLFRTLSLFGCDGSSVQSSRGPVFDEQRKARGRLPSQGFLRFTFKWYSLVLCGFVRPFYSWFSGPHHIGMCSSLQSFQSHGEKWKQLVVYVVSFSMFLVFRKDARNLPPMFKEFRSRGSQIEVKRTSGHKRLFLGCAMFCVCPLLAYQFHAKLRNVDTVTEAGRQFDIRCCAAVLSCWLLISHSGLSSCSNSFRCPIAACTTVEIDTCRAGRRIVSLIVDGIASFVCTVTCFFVFGVAEPSQEGHKKDRARASS